MKKSLIALVIGAAALGFANSAKADVNAWVAGSLSATVSSTQTDSWMNIDSSSTMGVAAEDTSGRIDSLGYNGISIQGELSGDGSVDVSGALMNKASASKNSIMVSSSSAASLSIVDGGSGTLTNNILNSSGTGTDNMSDLSVTAQIVAESYGKTLPVGGISAQSLIINPFWSWTKQFVCG